MLPSTSSALTYLLPCHYLVTHATEVLARRGPVRLILAHLLALLVAPDILTAVSNSLANRSTNIMGMALKLLIPLELRRSGNAFGSLELLVAQTRKDASKVVLAERALASLEASGLDAGELVSGDREGT